MKKDYSKEVNEIIKKYKKEDIEYGKPLNYLLFRNKATEEEIVNEIINCDNLEFVEKQIRVKEVRYLLYFVYSGKRGRAYIFKFNKKIRIITIYPLGKRTLKRYRKRFKK